MRPATRLALAAVVAAVLLGGSAAASSRAPLRVGLAPRVPAGARVVGALSPSTRMTATVVLQPRDAAGLQDYATAVSTPGSSVYRHFLTVPEFRQRFGPTEAQIAAVEASLRAHGLHPGAVTANGLSIPLTTTAGAIGHAFSTTLQRVALQSGRSAFVNSQAPLIDASVAGVVRNVVGLDNLAVPHPLAQRASYGTVANVSRHVATGGPQPCTTATATAAAAHTYTTDQIASAYGFSGLYGAGDEGAGQTVAIYELEGNFHSDITAYEACYGIAAPVSYKAVDGGAPPPSFAKKDGLETALDIENVVGLAPLASVVVYQGPNSSSGLPGAGPYDVYNQIVSDNLAHVISTSWGICEVEATPTVQQDENTLFQEAATQGQSIFAAAGDDGSEDCTLGPPTFVPLSFLAADDPGTQPFVTSAGGTSMPAIGPPPTESVWNGGCSSGPCGGGGGISDRWPMPSYQSGARAALNVINSNSSGAPCGAPAGSFCREVPDVSADANPSTGYAVYYHGSWANGTPLGGTSAAAPLWAALMADVNAFSACNDTPIGFANPVLYGTAGNVYAGHFNDVTVGNNDILGSNNGLFPAAPGYDMATGLGTPNATTLAQNLCAPAIGVSNPGPQRSMLHSAGTVQIIASDTSGRTLNFSATGLPPGASINSTTGAISGTLTQAGTYSVTVRAFEKDRPGSFGSSTFVWTVLGPPTQSSGGLGGVSTGQPKLSFTVSQGTAAPPLYKVVVSLPHGLTFSHKSRNLTKGITITGANGKHLSGYKISLSHGVLTLTLGHAQSKVQLTIASPAITASSGLINAAKHKRAHKLTINVSVTDSSGHVTPFGFKLKPS